MADGKEVGNIFVTMELKNNMGKGLLEIKTGLNNAGKEATKFGDNISNGVENSISKVNTNFKSFGNTLSQGFGNALSKVGNVVSSFGTSISKGLGSAFSSTGSIVKSFGTTLTSGLGNAFASAGTKISSFGGTLTTGLGNAFTSAGNSIRSFGEKISTGVGGAFASAGTSISTLGTKISTGLANSINSVIPTVTKLTSSITSGIGTALGSLSSKFAPITSGISGVLSKAQSTISNFTSTAVSSFGKVAQAGITLKNTIGIVGIAITGMLSKAIIDLGSNIAKTFMKFDDQMRKVQAVTESTGVQFEQLTSTARMLGATTSYTAQEAAEGMTLLGQAGFDANEIIAAMPATLNLARGSMTDLSTTADIMSNIMNGFRIAAEDTTRVSDVLSKAANATNTDVTGLGNAMKYVAPLAYQMGWSLESTAAAAGLLSNAGIKSSMAGTVLRNTISRLLSPTQKAEGILKSYGITMDAISPKTHSLAQIVQLLEQRQVSAADVMEVFGMRAGPGMLAMMNIGTAAIEKMNQTLLNSSGYAQAAADKMDAGWGGAIRRAGDAVEALQLSFGKAIATLVTPLLNAFSLLAIAISKIPQPILMVVVALGAIGAAALAAVAALGTIGIVIGALTSGLTLLVQAFPPIAAAIAAATGSIDILMVSMGEADLTLGMLIPSLGEIGTALTGLGAAALSIVTPLTFSVGAIAAIGVAMLGWDKSIQLVKDSFTILADFLGDIWTEIKNYVVNAINDIKEAIWSLAEDTGLASVITTIESLWNRASGAVNGYADNIHERAENIRAEDAKTAQSAETLKKS
ncbi:MAG: phage tail tape measure protein, partial [Ignavibacteria bacterium]|nr:phage tail tape measure protein [Ignavibacteria bacterium]